MLECNHCSESLKCVQGGVQQFGSIDNLVELSHGKDANAFPSIMLRNPNGVQLLASGEVSSSVKD